MVHFIPLVALAHLLHLAWIKLILLIKAKSAWALLTGMVLALLKAAGFAAVLLVGTIVVLDLLGVPADIIRDIVATFRLGSLAALGSYGLAFVWGVVRFLCHKGIIRAAGPYVLLTGGLLFSVLFARGSLAVFLLTLASFWFWFLFSLARALQRAWKWTKRTWRWITKEIRSLRLMPAKSH